MNRIRIEAEFLLNFTHIYSYENCFINVSYNFKHFLTFINDYIFVFYIIK